MSRLSPPTVLRVLLIVCGLITLGMAAYRLKLEWASPHGAPVSSSEMAADSNKPTIEELQSRKDALEMQMKVDGDLRKQKDAVDLMLITNNLILCVLFGLMFYLRRNDELGGDRKS